MSTRRIGLREIQALEPNRELWDTAVSGFGARRRDGSSVSYVLMFRNADGRQRRLTIGRHGAPWLPDTARAEARRILGEVASGGDPAADKKARRTALTVSELCDEYISAIESGQLLTRARRPKKASTVATDRSRIEAHIKPLLGQFSASAVAQHDVEDLLHAISVGKTAKRTKSPRKYSLSNIRGGKGAASRTVGLLGAIFAYAIKRRIRSDNPCAGVTRPADGRRERRLNAKEYASLGLALRQLIDEGLWPAAGAVARFLAVTGWRIGEVLPLRWSDVDLVKRTAVLPDSKTGRSIRPLSWAACNIVKALDRSTNLVFPSVKTGEKMSGYRSIWDKLIRRGGLPHDITPHVARHSFASVAADLGYSEVTIAALIGHSSGSVTSRYIHHADAPLLAAADKVADEIVQSMADVSIPGALAELRRA